VHVLPPLRPQSPVVRIAGATTVGRCDAVTLDGSSSLSAGGRALAFLWTVDALNDFAAAVVTDVTAALAVVVNVSALDGSANSSYAAGPLLRVANASLLPPDASFRFTLTATNFFGLSANASVDVRVASAAVPQLSLDVGSTLDLFRSKSAVVVARATQSTCGGDTRDALSFNWTVAATTSDPATTAGDWVVPLPAGYLRQFVTRDPSVLRIPADVLQVGAIIDVDVTVSVLGRPATMVRAGRRGAVRRCSVRCVCDVFRVAVRRTPHEFAFECYRRVCPRTSPMATVSTLSMTTQCCRAHHRLNVAVVVVAGELGSSSPVVLDASGSRDLDGVPTTVVPFAYTWSCRPLQPGTTVEAASQCTDVSGRPLDMAVMLVNATVAVVPGNTLVAGAYAFAVVATKGTTGSLIPRALRSAT
jgi:hypothetical protein